MNEVGEQINAIKAGERSFDTNDLLTNMRKGAFVTMASWGSHAFAVYKDLFVRFKVQGRKHKGYVYIALGWDDTFTLYFTTSKGKIKEKMEMIYVDVLIETIDRYVETD